MIKLLKYDLRRNASLLLVVVAALIVGELALMWSPLVLQIKLGLLICIHFAAAVIFTINNLMVFDYNIKSVSRRLLPVSTYAYVWASMLYAILNTLALMAIAAGPALYYISSYDTKFLGDAFDLPAYVWAELALEAVFAGIYGFLFMYAVIALTRSIVKKGVLWVGLLVFLVLSTVVDWVEGLLFHRDSSQVFSFITFKVDNGVLAHETFNSRASWNALGSLVFEILLCFVFLYVIKWCVEKRIEAK